MITLSLLFAIGSCGFFLLTNIEYASHEDEYPKMKRFIKKANIVMLITALLCIFIPSPKQIAAIYLIPKIVNNEDVKNVPDKVLRLMNEKLDQWIEDTLKTKDKK
jgi:hypothetical protein